MLTLEHIYFCVMVAIACHVYYFVLSDEGGILEWLQNLLIKITPVKMQGFLFCVNCLTGQAAFWLYIIIAWTDYSLLDHLQCVIVAIFISKILNKL